MTDHGYSFHQGPRTMVLKLLIAIGLAIALAGSLLASDGAGKSSTELLGCPPCDDNDACTFDYCETTTQQCRHAPVECEDYSVCTTDACDSVLGCQFVPRPNGEPCSDGNVCTEGDQCQSGVCQATYIDCSDGNACTFDYCDSNNGGQCAHITNDCSDQNSCTTDVCDPVTGQCSNTSLPNGAPCDDFNPCTTASQCVLERNGIHYCVETEGTPGVPCNDGNPCTHNDRCLPVGGDGGLRCEGTFQSCNDGNACTFDFCDQTGRCQNVSMNCNDSNPCTTDSCNPQSGCQWNPVPLGTPCDDNEFCTVHDVCVQQFGSTFCRGTPNPGGPCDDGNPCTYNTICVPPGNGQLCQGQYLTCEDGNPCTGNSCQDQGQCQVSPMQCDDSNPCTDDECSIPQGGCQHTTRANGSACNDHNGCTAPDTCQNGNCMGTQLNCDDGDPCTQDYCGGSSCFHFPYCFGQDNEACTAETCDPKTGQCILTPVANGTLCIDSDPCMGNGMCNMGVCQGTPVTCNDGNTCTDDSCQFGCQNVPRPDGSQCNDGSPCTLSDQCTLGYCYGTPIDCPDGDPCTIDSCHPQTGICQHEPEVLGEVTPVVFFDSDTLVWGFGAGPSWNTYRGSIPLLTLGSRLPGSVYDHLCFESADALGDGPTTTTDASLPAAGTAWYYDVTTESVCSEGPLGSSSAGAVRPNTSPCPTPP